MTFKLKNLNLKSKIIMPPMAIYKSQDGQVNDEIVKHYEDRAKNKHLGMIITEHLYINFLGKANPSQLSIADDNTINGLKKLVDAIHKHDVCAVAQINHAGSAAPESLIGQKPVSASSVLLPNKFKGEPIELTNEQIKTIIEDFTKAALRVKKAGYDGVEIHSAHGYLLNQFYSPLTNKRKDEYGGNLENRLRMLLEVISEVRKAVGENYLISVRLGGSDYMDGGSTIQDCVSAAKLIEKNGADMISLTGGMNGYNIPGKTEPGYFKDMSKQVIKNVSIPVLLTGGVKTLSDAENLLNEGVCDLVGVGRELLKNPNWQNNPNP